MRIRYAFILFVAVIFSAATQIFAAGGTTDDRLAKVTTFAFGGIGYAGTMSEGEAAFRQVWKQSDAARHFRLIFLWSTPEARCYALTALQILDPAEFKKCAEEFRQNPPERIQTMSGCLMNEESAQQVLERIEAGRYVPFMPERPNQAPEPTATLVTPRAGARVAPSAAVAHL
jgi:hypothetical protein